MTESSTPGSTERPKAKSKPVFVYLVGASGTGKTVLASALAERLDAIVYTGAARSVIARWHLTPQEMLGRTDKSSYFDFQMEVLKAHQVLEVGAHARAMEGGSVVLDRGIDHLAYLAHYCPVHFANPNEAVKKCLYGFAYRLLSGPELKWKDHYIGLAVYLPPVKQFVEKARAERPVELQPWLTDEAVYGVDACLKGLLTPFTPTGRVLSLADRTDLEFRVTSVMNRLEALGKR